MLDSSHDPVAQVADCGVHPPGAAGPLVDDPASVWQLRRALYAAGFHPVPVLTGRKFPIDREWQIAALSDAPPAVVNQPHRRTMSTGVACHGLRVVDVDVDDPELAARIEAARKRHLPPAPSRWRDGSPRAAYFYRAAEGAPGKRKVESAPLRDNSREKVEVLGDGQQVVIDGRHPEGGRYHVEPLPGVSFSHERLPVVTEEQITAFLADCAEVLGTEPADVPPATRTGGSGGRTGEATPCPDEFLAIVAQMPNPAHIDRNGMIRTAHGICAALPNDQDRARAAFIRWVSKWEGHTVGESGSEVAARVWDTLAPPHYAGASTIIEQAEELGVDVSFYRAADADAFYDAHCGPAEPPPDDARAGESESETAVIQFSDDARAAEFARRHVGQVVHVDGRKWFLWNGHKFAEGGGPTVRDLARLVCRDDAAHAARTENGRRIARGIASAKAARDLESLARNDPRHARALNEFDADPWLLNTPGGVVDLRTGELRRHRPGVLFMKATSAAPGGECPRFMEFLNQACGGDQELIGYLQRLFGYTLTGQTTEQCFAFLYGPGGNGKGVLVNTMATVLGDYATTATKDVLQVVRNDPHLTHLAALHGARMVTVPEVDAGRDWNESQLKSLSAGDPVSVRGISENPWTLRPVCKLFICGNQKPVLRNPDPAIERRLHLIPFTFKPPSPDLELGEVLRREAPGILAWAIEGCLEWQCVGLQPPTVVLGASKEYLAEQDLPAQWFAERCERDAAAQEPASVLFGDWRLWASANGAEAGTTGTFSGIMERLGVAKHRKNTGQFYAGVRLLPKAEDKAGEL